MKKNKLIVGAVALGLGLASFGAGADAKGKGPADGTCVAKGVSNLDGPTIAAAANGSLLGSNVVNAVILDHVFNGAKGVGAITGADC